VARQTVESAVGDRRTPRGGAGRHYAVTCRRRRGRRCSPSLDPIRAEPRRGADTRVCGAGDSSRRSGTVDAAREESRDESRPSRQECRRHENGVIPNSTTSGVLTSGSLAIFPGRPGPGSLETARGSRLAAAPRLKADRCPADCPLAYGSSSIRRSMSDGGM
jgi:hypothetical protein